MEERRRRMISGKRLAVVGVAVAVVALVIASHAAVAAEPGIIHFEFSGTFTDPDFCGTGETVNVAVAEHGTLFTDPNRPGVDESLTLEGRTVFTNPLNGDTVVIHFAGARENVFPGDPGRVIETDIGLRTQLVHQGPGGLLTRDAGYVVVDFTFSIVGGEIVLERGPHPFIEALVEGNDTSCELLTGALGLS
jgi:hypothetical protein